MGCVCGKCPVPVRLLEVKWYVFIFGIVDGEYGYGYVVGQFCEGWVRVL